MKALVYIEKKDGSPIGTSLELMTAANALGADITAVSADIPAECIDEDIVTSAVVKEARDGDYDVVLFSATTLGKIVTPRVAARLQAGSVNDAISIAADGDGICVIRPVYGGTAQQKIGIAGKAVLSVRGGSYPAPEAAPEIKEIAAPDADEMRIKILEAIAEAGEAVNLEDANIIVSGGRGMGSEEEFALCGELADLLGGVVGATRPAIENGWINRTHQVGQSGKIVAPDLYIACGVSGATQHVSGMSGSKYIIAINKDEEAPIFDVADIGIVGDVKKILPLMIEEFKKRQD